MADYCKDKNLLTCYLGTEGELRDVHSIVASRIAGCSYEDFRVLIKGEDKAAKSQRQAAKITLFATLYGAGAAKIAEGLGITQEEAQEYIDSIYAQFPGVVEWKQAVERRALQTGNVLIHGGTIRHLSKLITSGDKGVSSKAMRQAGNASIQSAGGNQIKRVMSRVWDSNLLDDYDFRWYFSIHDEVVISVGREHAVDVTRVMHGFMTEQFLDVVPSSSSIGVGRSFGNLVELPETFDAELLEKTVESLFTVA
jgi:DNA polymerase-1